jgi:hypothetical protein
MNLTKIYNEVVREADLKGQSLKDFKRLTELLKPTIEYIIEQNEINKQYFKTFKNEGRVLVNEERIDGFLAYLKDSGVDLNDVDYSFYSKSIEKPKSEGALKIWNVLGIEKSNIVMFLVKFKKNDIKFFE